jgi:hypothetical protein
MYTAPARKSTENTVAPRAKPAHLQWEPLAGAL